MSIVGRIEFDLNLHKQLILKKNISNKLKKTVDKFKKEV